MLNDWKNLCKSPRACFAILNNFESKWHIIFPDHWLELSRLSKLFSNVPISKKCKFLERLLCPIFLKATLPTPKTQQQNCLKNQGTNNGFLNAPGSPANGMAPTPKAAACFVDFTMDGWSPTQLEGPPRNGSRVGRISHIQSQLGKRKIFKSLVPFLKGMWTRSQQGSLLNMFLAAFHESQKCLRVLCMLLLV